MSMSTMVMGAGSIGSLFAGKLAYQGYSTSAVARPLHVRKIKQDGLHLLENSH